MKGQIEGEDMMGDDGTMETRLDSHRGGVSRTEPLGPRSNAVGDELKKTDVL